jgi:hypothetical protein
VEREQRVDAAVVQEAESADLVGAAGDPRLNMPTFVYLLR